MKVVDILKSSSDFSVLQLFPFFLGESSLLFYKISEKIFKSGFFLLLKIFI